ncbi:lipid II-degrading bacteriocin [Luteibacter yeojuensis]|uniref:lipid II-degrading bacteriocin n=1 Tax=Luteibacter yeojuensis TaxID=345309 RepID=UPI000697CBCA|nr:lipid II-degrading bacteriocin [Luteibacter yeojuensis]
MSVTPLAPVPVFGYTSDPFYGLGNNAAYNGTRVQPGPIMPPSMAGLPPMNHEFYGKCAMTNGEKVFEAALRGDPLGTLTAFFEGLSARDGHFALGQLFIWNNLQVVLGEGYNRPIAANEAGLLAPNGRLAITHLAGLYVTRAGNAPVEIKNPAFDFWGTPLMSIAGIYYWVAGGGKSRRVRIASLGLHLVPRDFEPVQDILQNALNGPGLYEISGPFEHNTFDHGIQDVWAAGLIGRVKGWVTGKLEIRADHSYQFNGSFTLAPDTYDAGAGNRPFAQEALTSFLAGIGNTLGYKDYDIEFVGEQAVEGSGVRW